MRNRFIFINPDESKEQDWSISRQQQATIIEDQMPDENLFLTAQAMTKSIVDATMETKVGIPFYISYWPFEDKRWLLPQFLYSAIIITKINYKKRKIDENGKLIMAEEDLIKARDLWKKFIERIIYRVSLPAKQVLDILPFGDLNAMTKAELAIELGCSTQHLGELLEELEEAGLISSQKMEDTKRKGLHSEEFWKNKLPGTEAITWKPLPQEPLELNLGPPTLEMNDRNLTVAVSAGNWCLDLAMLH